MRFKKVFSNLELEGQGRGIIMGVTRLLLLGPFYYIQTDFQYFFAHDCKYILDKKSPKPAIVSGRKARAETAWCFCKLQLAALYHCQSSPCFVHLPTENTVEDN